jgi:hypothetical protein
MRDPSHTRALPLDQLKRLLEAAGGSVVHETGHDQALSVSRWLSQAQTPADVGDAIRTELNREVEGGEPTGMRPQTIDGELHLTHRYAILVAQTRRG